MPELGIGGQNKLSSLLCIFLVNAVVKSIQKTGHGINAINVDIEYVPSV